MTGAIDSFYETVVQNLKPWAPAAPRLRSDEASADRPANVPAALVSTALSSQDDTDQELHRTLTTATGNVPTRTAQESTSARTKRADTAPRAPWDGTWDEPRFTGASQ